MWKKIYASVSVRFFVGKRRHLIGCSLSDHLDLHDPGAEGPSRERLPTCRSPDRPTTLDLLEGVRGSARLGYGSEVMLAGALQRLGGAGEVRSEEFVGTRIASALDKVSRGGVGGGEAGEGDGWTDQQTDGWVDR